MLKRILSFVLVFVICAYATISPVSAVSPNSDSSDETIPLPDDDRGDWGFFYQHSDFAQWAVRGGLADFLALGTGAISGAAAAAAGASLGVIGITVGAGVFAGFFTGKALGVPLDDMFNIWGDQAYIEYGYDSKESFLADMRNPLTTLIDDVLHDFGLGWLLNLTDLSDPSASYQYQTQGYVGTVGSTQRYFDSLDMLYSLKFPFFYFLEECGIQQKVMVFACNHNRLTGFYFDADGILKIGYFTGIDNPDNVMYCTMYDYSSLQLVSSMICQLNTYDGYVFYDFDSARNHSEYLSKKMLVIDWTRNGDSFWKNHNGDFFYLYGFVKDKTSSVFSSSSTEIAVTYRNSAVDGDFSGYGYTTRMDAYELVGGYQLKQPENHTEQSRPSGIMDAIQEYNTTNNYYDNSVVNYYIGSFDENDNLTGYYPMDIYDEQTLVFTEPVTGAQYQTAGWTYDYAARRYMLDLQPGTFALGDYDILQIRLTYGDEAVTIQYYNELGELVETDEYQYIMVAKEECTLNGHSYLVETTKEPSCTVTGERVYTCSVCGDQRVEDIPMMEHSGVYSVFQEATCTDPGVGLLTCSTCGTQVTEEIPALGHDWVSVEDVETSYQLPEGTACPACAGVDFSTELDQINEVYSCSCVSCGQIWTVDALVQHGYTTYECSRCGITKTESKSQQDGLFVSIGNLIGDGIVWCTEKLTQLVDSLTGIVDTFTSYLDSLASTGGAFPGFLALLFTALPEELTNLLWLSLVGLVALLVWKKWLG